MSNHKDEQKEFVSLKYFGIPRLFPYLKPYKGIMICMVLLGLLGGTIDIILPLFQRFALNNFIGKNTLDALTPFILAYVGVLIVQVFANGISAYQACQI